MSGYEVTGLTWFAVPLVAVVGAVILPVTGPGLGNAAPALAPALKLGRAANVGICKEEESGIMEKSRSALSAALTTCLHCCGVNTSFMLDP